MAHENQEEQGNSPLYPIREVSRLTGVNTVTLRAWERRYGLVIPQRTPKGHRLYSAEDIENVRRILQWLDKGVSVSQVGDLLDQPPEMPMPVQPAGDWETLQQQLRNSLEQLDEERLDLLFCDAYLRWPGHQLVSELLRPLINTLPAASAAFSLLLRYLRSRIGERLQHRCRTLSGPRVLLLSQDNPAEQLFALLALSDTDFQVFWLDQPVNFEAMCHCAEKYRPQLILLADQQLSASQQQQLQQVGRGPLVLLSPEQPLDATSLYNLLRNP
ncbi:MerR family transcriptional regulator [Marinospirillum alkaliphilum]|uniref:Transcriptional regulator, MerR family n=1 Tax=Marinospirillum alkaliphilum DSM 21637 TaxID=1122209 RepID=A0A1K1Y1I4_9GAMM|nr:MerR family transcriptional regulator [Marinospirillum alkaliphilum]SFX55759.1 transcriptional regulator, MerR family [Marinospirillum alkaliphilum DSM 21637]